MPSEGRLLVAIGGGIAAYKVCEVISSVFQSGCQVKVVLSQSALKFITPLSVATLSRNPAYTDDLFWSADNSRPLHIELAQWAQLILIAPMTANTLAKLAHGFADNLLTNTILASDCPILAAPAMNTLMWQQISLQRNWQLLQEDPRYHSVGPSSGRLACDAVGDGRMAEPESIIAAIESLFLSGGKRDLVGKSVLVTAGGTREYLDQVRYLGNPSTGRMGIALATAAHYRGAQVTLIGSNLEKERLICLPEIPTLSADSSREMLEMILEQFSRIKWLFMVAAVGDVKPANYYGYKLAKREIPKHLELEPVVDILQALSQHKTVRQTIIGFAAQSGDILTPARQKLERKQLDVILANPIDQLGAGFGSENNQGIILDSKGRKKTIESCSKLELANILLDFVQEYVDLSVGEDAGSL